MQDFEEVSCEQLSDPGEVTGLAFDPTSNRFALCTRDGVVQIYTLDSSMQLRPLHLKSIPNSSPQAIAFGGMHGNERDVLIFNLYSGHMCVVN